MLPLHARRFRTAGLLALAVAVGLALRLAPLAADPGGDFTSDQGFHLRMIAEVAAHGRVPALDHSSEAPEGRPVARLLPVGLYHAAAALYVLLAWAGVPSPRAAALLFTGLAGALIALPVFLLAGALFRDRRAAWLAAFAAVILPAHLHRTFCWWLRYDGLGTLLALAHLAFLARALGAERGRRAALEAVAAGLLLALAVACWRVVLVLPPLEAAALLLLLLARGLERPASLAFAVSLGVAAVACAPIDYVRAQGLLLSRAWLVPLAVAGVALAPWMRPGATRPPGRAQGANRGGARWPARLLTAGAAAALAWLAGGWTGAASAYSDVMQIAPARLALLAGGHARVTPITALLLDVAELGGTRPVELIGPAQLSWLGAWCAGALALRWLEAGRLSLARARAARPAPALFAFLLVALTLATLLFARDKVLLAPLVAVLVGGLAAWATGATPGTESLPSADRARVPAGARRGGRRAAAPRGERGAPRWARGVALAGLVLCAAVTLFQSVQLAATRRSRIEPGLGAALAWLRAHTPPDAVVMGPWQQGYDLQSFAARASAMDGLLESRENQRRIVEFAAAAMSADPSGLADDCRSHHARWLLVPPSTQMLSVARVAGMPFTDKIRSGVPLNRDEGDRVLIRMMVLGDSQAPFRLAFESGGYRVYAVEAAPAPPAPAGGGG